jgi:hypothetical protein
MIEDNLFQNNHATNGGHISCNINSNPVIRNNTLDSGSAGTAGSGIYISQSSPLVEGNTICNGSKGAVRCYSDSSPLFQNNLICNNSTNHHGGAFYISHGGTPEIRDCLILDNTSEQYGGAVYCYKASPLMVNCIIAGNHGGTGGAYYGEDNSDTHFMNCTLTDNTIEVGNTGSIEITSSHSVFTNTIIWNQQGYNKYQIRLSGSSILDISYCDVRGGENKVYKTGSSQLNWGPGMIDAFPDFVNPTADDYHILYTSPCRDAGDPSAPGLPSEDFEGDPRLANGMADMGADEFHTHLYYTGEASPGGSMEIKITDAPGTAPLYFWLGSGVLDPPWNTKYGLWYLEYPLLLFPLSGSIPSPGGVYVLPVTLPPDVSPYPYPTQAGCGSKLTNLCVIEIQ